MCDTSTFCIQVNTVSEKEIWDLGIPFFYCKQIVCSVNVSDNFGRKKRLWLPACFLWYYLVYPSRNENALEVKWISTA